MAFFGFNMNGPAFACVGCGGDADHPMTNFLITPTASVCVECGHVTDTAAPADAPADASAAPAPGGDAGAAPPPPVPAGV